jgi:hypothetical protein
MPKKGLITLYANLRLQAENKLKCLQIAFRRTACFLRIANNVKRISGERAPRTLCRLDLWIIRYHWLARCFVPMRSLARLSSAASDRTSISVPNLELVFGWFRLQSVRG